MSDVITKYNDTAIKVTKPVDEVIYADNLITQIKGIQKSIDNYSASISELESKKNYLISLLNAAINLGVDTDGVSKIVPQTLTPFQLNMALYKIGKYTQVQSLLNASGNEVMKIAYSTALVFKRQHAMILGAAQALNMSSEDLDNLFILGATIS